MEKAIYKGVNGVFIPADEFEHIKETINNNKILLQRLAKEIAKDNPEVYREIFF
jgi:PHD/YefM family antitoxin component YafN of YafNO toxin-antitoxin module